MALNVCRQMVRLSFIFAVKTNNGIVRAVCLDSIPSLLINSQSELMMSILCTRLMPQSGSLVIKTKQKVITVSDLR